MPVGGTSWTLLNGGIVNIRLGNGPVKPRNPERLPLVGCQIPRVPLLKVACKPRITPACFCKPVIPHVGYHPIDSKPINEFAAVLAHQLTDLMAGYQTSEAKGLQAYLDNAPRSKRVEYSATKAADSEYFGKHLSGK